MFWVLFLISGKFWAVLCVLFCALGFGGELVRAL